MQINNKKITFYFTFFFQSCKTNINNLNNIINNINVNDLFPINNNLNNST